MTPETILLRIRRSLGIETLLPMQERMATLPLPVRALIQAPTGSGKTLAFAIALLRSLKQGNNGVAALVIAPTRELTLQIFDTIRPLAAPEFKTAALYGGHSFEAEANSLLGKPDIIIGTPGRLLDHINRRRLDLSGTGTLVIDEYDKALELGFAPDMKRILATMKKVVNLILTSATTGDIPEFIGAVDSVFDYRNESPTTMPATEVYSITSATADKLSTLKELLKALGDKRTIVFVNHRDAAERVYNYLRDEGFCACLYHGGLDQDVRERALILFSNGTAHIMVATDLAARGLDIDSVEAIVHYHLPSSAEAWTHRNGRTGRIGGSEGSAFVILSAKDRLPEYAETKPCDLDALTPVNYPRKTTLYLNAGKKEKISRGDIAGFLIAKGGLAPDEVGRIDIRDHCAYVAVPADKARQTVLAVAPYKIKNTRVRVTQLKN